MLIINADDWGGWPTATDAALACYQKGRITSVSAMVFMADSERAAALAKEAGMDVGLHLNFSQPFTDSARVSRRVADAHQAIVRFLRSSKYALLLYHPLLRRQFGCIVEAQLEEFVRLYGKAPSHYDGHQHMHLCTNMLFDHNIPKGGKVRRNFSFRSGEKSALNRAYRRWVDRRLARRYRLTDFFFCLGDCLKRERLGFVFRLANEANIELMTHPERPSERAFLLCGECEAMLNSLNLQSYAEL